MENSVKNCIKILHERITKIEKFLFQFKKDLNSKDNNTNEKVISE